MTRKFTDFAFTDAVQAFQQEAGTRAQNAKLEADGTAANDRLGAAEAAFIARRDGFYIATVGEGGWPYVQFRGGPPGFLRVLDERTLGYADFRGNLQYLTDGNLTADDRVMLFLMDYANRRRLKLWGRARIVGVQADPALVVRLAIPGYRATVERAVLIAVEAFDWNCQQHIPIRYSEAEVQQIVAGLLSRIAELEARVAQLEPSRTHRPDDETGPDRHPPEAEPSKVG